MPFYFTLMTEESSLLVGNEPSADAIWNAIDTVVLPSGAFWVGPLARITRRNDVSVRPFKTRVVRVLEVDEPYTSDAALGIARTVASKMDAALAPLSSTWTQTSERTYDPAQDGPLPTWQSGAAAVPQQQDNLPNSAGEVVESGLHRLGGAASSLLAPAKTPLLIAVAVGIVVFGTLALWPRIARARRSNPRKRRAVYR